MGYLLKTTPTEIITAKVTLTKANLLTPGYIYDIPEFPAVTGKFWNVIYMIGQIIDDGGAYSGTSTIHIQASTAPDPQIRFTGGFMANIAPVFCATDIITSIGNRFVENDKLQIHNPGMLTGGGNILTVYIGANLITY